MATIAGLRVWNLMTAPPLLELEAILARSSERAARAHEAADWVRRAGPYRWVGIYEVTPQTISALAWTGSVPPAFPSFPRSQGLSGAAVSSGAPVIVPDVTRDPRYLTAFGTTRSEAIFPVSAGVDGHVVGTLDVESDRVDAFAHSDVDFLGRCAAALASLWTQGSSPKQVVVVPYDPAWPRLFESLRAPIWNAVADIAVAIEHVGSTSVPGLPAKAVIDINVIVAERDVTEGIARLVALGYDHCGDLGVPAREAFRRPAGSAPHHLYLCPSNSPALANHLALRDYLRDHADAARVYGELKTRLAAEHAGDIDAYIAGKTEFIVRILHEAGIPASAIAEIEAMNRRPAERAK